MRCTQLHHVTHKHDRRRRICTSSTAYRPKLHAHDPAGNAWYPVDPRRVLMRAVTPFKGVRGRLCAACAEDIDCCVSTHSYIPGGSGVGQSCDGSQRVKNELKPVDTTVRSAVRSEASWLQKLKEDIAYFSGCLTAWPAGSTTSAN